ncbi:MAG: tyrosine-protein phosphatase [Microthrixaceae bacterium]
MPTGSLRPLLARDGIFNTRDLGGLPAAEGRALRPGLLVRGDSLHRARHDSRVALHDHGVRMVLDLRDHSEQATDGVFAHDGIELAHHPVLDPNYAWDAADEAALEPTDGEASPVLVHRYAEILEGFGGRFVGAVEKVAATDGGVAFHCAVGKDRTGLLAMLLLDLLGVPDDVIVADYGRSALATAVQTQWLWIHGHPYGDPGDDELHLGVWSARPATMDVTLRRFRARHGGAEAYLLDAGLDPSVPGDLRARLLGPAGPSAG